MREDPARPVRKLLRWLGFDRPEVASTIDPMFSLTAGASDLGSDHLIKAVRDGGMESLNNGDQDRDAFAKAEEGFREALPDLLQESHKRGRWVLYSAEGLVEEGDDELGFYAKYGDLIGTRLFLGRIHPEAPEAEVNPNWFTTLDKSTKVSPSRTRR